METSPITDMLSALKAAQSDACRLSIARRVVRAREAMGDYASVIQGPLMADMLEAMSRALAASVTVNEQLPGVPVKEQPK